MYLLKLNDIFIMIIDERLGDFMKCKKCGAELSNDANFCKICGNPTNNQPKEEPEDKSNIELTDNIDVTKIAIEKDNETNVIEVEKSNSSNPVEEKAELGNASDLEVLLDDDVVETNEKNDRLNIIDNNSTIDELNLAIDDKKNDSIINDSIKDNLILDSNVQNNCDNSKIQNLSSDSNDISEDNIKGKEELEPLHSSEISEEIVELVEHSVEEAVAQLSTNAKQEIDSSHEKNKTTIVPKIICAILVIALACCVLYLSYLMNKYSNEKKLFSDLKKENSELKLEIKNQEDEKSEKHVLQYNGYTFDIDNYIILNDKILFEDDSYSIQMYVNKSLTFDAMSKDLTKYRKHFVNLGYKVNNYGIRKVDNSSYIVFELINKNDENIWIVYSSIDDSVVSFIITSNDEIKEECLNTLHNLIDKAKKSNDNNIDDIQLFIEK